MVLNFILAKVLIVFPAQVILVTACYRHSSITFPIFIMPNKTKQPTIQDAPDSSLIFEVIPKTTGNHIRYNQTALPVLPDASPPACKSQVVSQQQCTTSTQQPASQATYSNNSSGLFIAADLSKFAHSELYQDEPDVQHKNVCHLHPILDYTHKIQMQTGYTDDWMKHFQEIYFNQLLAWDNTPHKPQCKFCSSTAYWKCPNCHGWLLMCKECCLLLHQYTLFHCVEELQTMNLKDQNGVLKSIEYFDWSSLHKAGLKLWLGHSGSRCSCYPKDDVCLTYNLSKDTDFVFCVFRSYQNHSLYIDIPYLAM